MAEGDLSDCPIQLQAKQSARGSPSHITNTVVCVVKGKMNWKENTCGSLCDCGILCERQREKNEAKLALFYCSSG